MAYAASVAQAQLAHLRSPARGYAFRYKTRKVSWYLLSILLSMHILTRLRECAGWTGATLAAYCIPVSPIIV